MGLALGANCAGEPAGSALSARDGVRAGAAREQAPAGPPGQATLRRVLSIGAREGDPRDLFGKIGGVAVSHTGDTLYVVDRLAAEVRAYSGSTGAFLFAFGRRGRGPGEFEDPAAVVALPWNGRLAVWDPALQRITVVSRDGAVLGTRALGDQRLLHPLPRLGRTIWGVRAFRDGWVMEVRSDPLRVPPPGQRGYLVRLDTAFQVVDTVLSFPVPQIRARHRESGGARWSAWDEPPLFSPQPQWDLFEDGRIVYSPADAYDVRLYAAAGRLIRQVKRDVPRRPVTRGDRVQLLDDALDEATGGVRLPATVLEPLFRHRFARTLPAIAGVLAAPDGGFWVQRFDTRDDPRGRSRTWDVYDADARPLGSVRLPPATQPLLIARRGIYALRRDAFRVESIEIYVPRPWPN